MKQAKVREAIYETVLSIDGLMTDASDNDSPFDFLKDPHLCTGKCRIIRNGQNDKSCHSETPAQRKNGC